MVFPKGSFPQRFSQYWNDIDERFENDWPSVMVEKELEECNDALPKDDISSETFKRVFPGYEVTDKRDKFEVKVDVPGGFEPEEIEVGLTAGGRLLSVNGAHKVEEAGKSFLSMFQQNFSLGRGILTDEITANFEHGKLVVSAPRNVERLPRSRKIPIKMIGVTEGETTKRKHEEGKKGEAKHESKKENLKP